MRQSVAGNIMCFWTKRRSGDFPLRWPGHNISGDFSAEKRPGKLMGAAIKCFIHCFGWRVGIDSFSSTGSVSASVRNGFRRASQLWKLLIILVILPDSGTNQAIVDRLKQSKNRTGRKFIQQNRTVKTIKKPIQQRVKAAKSYS